MKRLLLVILLMSSPLFGQSVGGRWFSIHDSAIDTLTGVAADSTLEEVSLKKTIYFPRGGNITMVPRSLMIVTVYDSTLSGNAEGITQRDGFGDNLNNQYNGFSTKDTLVTAAGTAADTYSTVDILTNPGDAYKYSLKQYDSAADTDSATVRRYIYGLY